MRAVCGDEKCLSSTVDEVDSGICPDRAAHLANLERKGGTLKLGLHLSTLKEAEVTRLLGRGAVGLGRCQF